MEQLPVIPPATRAPRAPAAGGPRSQQTRHLQGQSGGTARIRAPSGRAPPPVKRTSRRQTHPTRLFLGGDAFKRELPAAGRQPSPDRTGEAAYETAEAHAKRVVGEELARRKMDRGGLRVLLGAQLDVPPGEVPLAQSDSGKLRLAGDPSTKVEFNVAHSDSVTLIALSPSAGIANGLATVEVTASEAAAVRRIDGDPQAGAAWSLRELEPAPRHLGCVAVRQSEAGVVLHEFTPAAFS